MQRSFVLRVQADDPGVARTIARAIVAPLRERGARVRLDGAPMGGGATMGVSILTATRGLPGATFAVGVLDHDDGGARWLAPIDVAPDPETAADFIVRFLEGWGFIGTRTGARQRAA